MSGAGPLTESWAAGGRRAIEEHGGPDALRVAYEGAVVSDGQSEHQVDRRRDEAGEIPGDDGDCGVVRKARGTECSGRIEPYVRRLWQPTGGRGFNDALDSLVVGDDDDSGDADGAGQCGEHVLEERKGEFGPSRVGVG